MVSVGVISRFFAFQGLNTFGLESAEAAVAVAVAAVDIIVVIRTYFIAGEV